MKSALVRLFLALVLLPAFPSRAANPFGEWRHSGALHVLTTPAGAAMPKGEQVEGFPLLVRLHRDWFDFSGAKAGGADLRFSDASGTPLPHQVEEWDPEHGTAAVWVRMPVIRGDEDQEIRMHWGRADAPDGSDGKAVFNASNGYLGVWHMDGTVRDTVGTLESVDVGTTSTAGVVGRARHLAGGQGIAGGEKVTGLPAGAAPHTSEAWIRVARPNGRILGWGNEHAQGKVVMQFQSPPHIRMDCYFSAADVSSRGRLPMDEWIQVVHTWRPGESRVYVDGVLAGSSTRQGSPLAIRSPARLWIGGWYGHYDFVGDIDEVRLSGVARTPAWVRLQHENQKPLQTLVGMLVRPGDAFSLSVSNAVVAEGSTTRITARADGALKLSWRLRRDGHESVVAVDRLAFDFVAGRVTGDRPATLLCTAVYPDGVRTREVAIVVKEAVEDPSFTLSAPSRWDGRTPVEVVARVRNAGAMRAKGAGEVTTSWKTGPFAVVKEVAPGKLVLLRAQNSGRLTVTATLDNGGAPVSRSVDIVVSEPAHDPWVSRTPGRDEMPEDGQFYARDDRGEGTLVCNGTLAPDVAADAVFLRLYADDRLARTVVAKPGRDRSFALSARLKPGLVHYRVEFGARSGGAERVLHTATNLVCGDAYLIDGQSNALATDTGEKAPAETDEWVRSYGRPPQERSAAPGNLWCNPVWKARQGEKAELGWWGMELARGLVRDHRIPVFVLNAAVGGTRIDQHQRDPSHPDDPATLYGNMLWRLRHARLTHGIRAVLWHQGENDQGADGPTGGYGWETYQAYFEAMAGGWRRDLPNLRHVYAFQIWPDSCAMGGREGSGDMLREQQRTLPRMFSNLDVLSTLGVRPPGGCHFPLAGWAEFAHMVRPLIDRDFHGRIPKGPITPPNLRRAAFASAAKDAVVLEFDQPVAWTPSLAGQFYLDGEKGRVVSGTVAGNTLVLRLGSPSAATRITYLKEVAWNQDTLLRGENGMAALTFCNVPFEPPARARKGVASP